MVHRPFKQTRSIRPCNWTSNAMCLIIAQKLIFFKHLYYIITTCANNRFKIENSNMYISRFIPNDIFYPRYNHGAVRDIQNFFLARNT